MKEHPILFSTPMVQAILEGRKTMTRRIIKNVPDDIKGTITWGYSAFTPKGYISLRTKYKTDKGHHYGEKFFKLPYGGKGGIVWVREAFEVHVCNDGGDDYQQVKLISDGCFFKYNTSMRPGNHPSIHLPKECSRLKLEIINIKVERLQDVSEDDAKAEGVIPFPKDLEGDCWTDGKYKTAYEYLWNNINGWKPNSWNENQFVWVIEFKKSFKKS